MRRRIAATSAHCALAHGSRCSDGSRCGQGARCGRQGRVRPRARRSAVATLTASNSAPPKRNYFDVPGAQPTATSSNGQSPTPVRKAAPAGGGGASVVDDANAPLNTIAAESMQSLPDDRRGAEDMVRLRSCVASLVHRSLRCSGRAACQRRAVSVRLSPRLVLRRPNRRRADCAQTPAVLWAAVCQNQPPAVDAYPRRVATLARGADVDDRRRQRALASRCMTTRRIDRCPLRSSTLAVSGAVALVGSCQC